LAHIAVQRTNAGRLIKVFRKSATNKQLCRQKPGAPKPASNASVASFFKKKEACVAMPVFRYFTVVGSALLALLFISDAYFGDSESNSRFNGSLYESALYAPLPAETAVRAELRFTRDVSPAARVKEVFAQFVPNESRRGKRYSSTAAVIQ
jgi:hypothetical protein